jgi:hypothetical protein
MGSGCPGKSSYSPVGRASVGPHPVLLYWPRGQIGQGVKNPTDVLPIVHPLFRFECKAHHKFFFPPAFRRFVSSVPSSHVAGEGGGTIVLRIDAPVAERERMTFSKLSKTLAASKTAAGTFVNCDCQTG